MGLTLLYRPCTLRGSLLFLSPPASPACFPAPKELYRKRYSRQVDLLKGLLIIGVVFGHLLRYVTDLNDSYKMVYELLYLFHMPAFTLLAGYTSAPGARFNRSYIVRQVKRLLLPLVMFTLLYEAAFYYEAEHLSGYTLAWQPYWILWFLWSLFWWRLLLPLVSRYLVQSLAVSVVVALLAGIPQQIGYGLGLGRTLVFLPFFLAGVWLKTQPALLLKMTGWQAKFPVRVMLAASAGLMFCALVIWLFRPDIRWLYGGEGYQALGVDIVTGLTMRLELLLLTGLCLASWGILLLHGCHYAGSGTGPVQRAIYRLEQCGKNSLYVYLWHGFFVNSLVTLDAPQRFAANGVLAGLFLQLAVATILTLFLSHPAVAVYTSRLLYPRFIFR